MRSSLRHVAFSVAVGLSAFQGCGTPVPEGNPLEDPKAASASLSEADQEFNGKISQIMNDSQAKFRELDYEYAEDLLTILDKVEKRLAGKLDKLDPLPMPKLDEKEQLDHLRETIRRWEAKTKKTLRAELDPLLADVAARKPGGPAFHPEFQKKFAQSFDEFIPIEVAEVRERRNKVIHAQAKPLLDEYRSKAPDAVKSAEATLNAPPYNLATETPDAKPGG